MIKLSKPYRNSKLTNDANKTTSLAAGDVDGDGDIDLVAGNDNSGTGQVNRLYLNNGTSDPFSGVVGSNVTADEESTGDVALGDVDSDGDLDLLAGGSYDHKNRLYLNNAR